MNQCFGTSGAGGVSGTGQPQRYQTLPVDSCSGEVDIGVAGKTGYACAASASFEEFLTTSMPTHIAAANDPAQPPFGAFAPTRAQAAIISLAQRSRLRRGAFRPMLTRLVNLLRAGPIDVQYQHASFRFYPQASATERGALFNPDYNLEELDFLRAHTPGGGVFVDVGANVGTYAMALARNVGARGKVIAIEPHPVTHARLAFNRAASGFTQVRLVAAAAGAADGELMIETDGDNLGASHVVSGEHTGHAFRVPSLRLQRVLEEADVERVDALKIDVEGYEDRVLTGFFAEAPRRLWPRAVVIEHLSRDEWQDDCIADMRGRGYDEMARTRSNTLLLRSSI
jgi:FkbM family methyltransferase